MDNVPVKLLQEIKGRFLWGRAFWLSCSTDQIWGGVQTSKVSESLYLSPSFNFEPQRGPDRRNLCGWSGFWADSLMTNLVLDS